MGGRVAESLRGRYNKAPHDVRLYKVMYQKPKFPFRGQGCETE
jgi:hypothetical protein